jgi:hypothetical protein
MTKNEAYYRACLWKNEANPWTTLLFEPVKRARRGKGEQKKNEIPKAIAQTTERSRINSQKVAEITKTKSSGDSGCLWARADWVGRAILRNKSRQQRCQVKNDFFA